MIGFGIEVIKAMLPEYVSFCSVHLLDSIFKSPAFVFDIDIEFTVKRSMSPFALMFLSVLATHTQLNEA